MGHPVSQFTKNWGIYGTDSQLCIFNSLAWLYFFFYLNWKNTWKISHLNCAIWKHFGVKIYALTRLHNNAQKCIVYRVSALPHRLYIREQKAFFYLNFDFSFGNCLNFLQNIFNLLCHLFIWILYIFFGKTIKYKAHLKWERK